MEAQPLDHGTNVIPPVPSEERLGTLSSSPTNWMNDARSETWVRAS